MAPPTASARALVAAAVILGVGLGGCAGGEAQPGVVRLGYFPNLTHAQALYAMESGLLQERLGDVRLEAMVFHAGPVALEALLSGGIDVLYVGPAPTMNALQAAGGERLRIVAGAAEGGAALVLMPGVQVDGAGGPAGLRLASPQLGNTQDIALKHWLLTQGHRTLADGGDVDVVNTSPADILSLFRHGRGIDGAWVTEPWVARLVGEAGGLLHLDEATLWPEGRYVTTQLVATTAFVQSHREELVRLLSAHAEATRRLEAQDAETLRTVNAGLERAGGAPLQPATLEAAMARIRFTVDPNLAALEELHDRARALGYTHGRTIDLGRAVDTSLLDEALRRSQA